jgi:uncharacterized protein (TIGR02246 family)
MRLGLVVLLAMWAALAAGAEVTVVRPKSIIADDWAFYIMVGGQAVSDVRNGERTTLQVPPETPALVIHCPKVSDGYEESRMAYDFRANPRAVFVISPTTDCVKIQALDAAAAAPVVRDSVQRANRRVYYDAGKVAAAAPVAAAASGDGVRGEVAAATAAWLDAFNSRDAGRIASLYDPEAVLTDAAEANPWVGGAAIADYYKANAQRSTQRAALGERNVRVFGDTAIDSGMLTFFEMRNGQATTTPARYSLTYRNRGGKWLIVDHQSSPAPR